MRPTNEGVAGQILCLLGVALLCAFSCTYARSTREYPSRPLVHLEYRSGGDAPLGFILTFYDDRRLRFVAPDGKIHQARLPKEEFAELQSVIASDAFGNELRELRQHGQRFGCCDAREIGVYVGSVDEPVAVVLESGYGRGAAMTRLIQLVNGVGHRNFLAWYSVPIPL